MDIDVKKYAEQLAQESGLSEEDKQVFLKVVGNEQFSKRLGEGVMLRSDYSRNMDELSKKVKRNEDWYAQELKTQAGLEQAKTDYERKLAELGEVDPGEGKPLISSPAFDEKKLREELDQRDARTVDLFKVGLKLATRHAVEFKEELDTDRLAKLAAEGNLSLPAAYNEMVRERREATAQLARETELKNAREEGAREFASRHHVPIDTRPKEPHLIFDKPTQELPPAGPLRERALRNSFEQSWNEASATSGATK